MAKREAPLLLAVMGPTASGKSDLAEALAERLDAVLLNADAFQVYRYLDIGTAKPADRSRYRLLDIRDPNEAFGVGEFVLRSLAELRTLYAEGRNTIVVGGTGLYVRALFEGYRELAPPPDPELRDRLNRLHADFGVDGLVTELRRVGGDPTTLDARNPVRLKRAIERLLGPSSYLEVDLPPFSSRKFALIPHPHTLGERIALRVQKMVQNGWVDEVRFIRDLGYSVVDPGLRALGYREMWRVLDGEMRLEDAIAETQASTVRYAKRQRTWLRTEPHVEALEADGEGARVEALARLRPWID